MHRCTSSPRARREAERPSFLGRELGLQGPSFLSTCLHMFVHIDTFTKDMPFLSPPAHDPGDKLDKFLLF